MKAMGYSRAYHVRCKNADEAQRVVDALNALINASRFTAKLETVTYPRMVRVYICPIRLRQTKDYRGNHPGPCQVSGRRHKKTAYLEGMDWVAFNDMVNDALDSIHHDGIAGSVVNIRQGKKRRTYYGMTTGPHVDWLPQGDCLDYADYCGQQAPRSELPNGTPGIRGYLAEVA
jgi:hypothetical protein